MSTVSTAEPVGTVRWRWGSVFAVAWLGLLVPVVWDAFERGTNSGVVGGIALIVFGASYVYAVRGLRAVFRADTPGPTRPVVVTITLMVVGAVIAIAMLGVDGLATAPYLAVVGPILIRRFTLVWVLGFAAGAELVAYLLIGSWSANLGVATGTLSAGLSVWVFALLMQRQRDQLAAKDADARLSLIEERGRFSRDLHDILGHSLTAIAIRAELAGRLAQIAPERAEVVMGEVEQLARDALEDVRRAVEGYREISLLGELSRARDALASAEITAQLPTAWDPVARDVECLYAWTVREGVTNVLRHSEATQCSIVVTSTTLTISDNGQGMPEQSRSGHGLLGLRERAAAADAVLILDSAPGAGCRLSVSVQTAPTQGTPVGDQEARS